METKQEAKQQNYYIHMVLFPGPWASPGHSCVVVTDKPYEFSERSVKGFWTYPITKKEGTPWDQYRHECALYQGSILGAISAIEPRAVCINTIDLWALEQARSDISDLYGTGTFLCIKTSKFNGSSYNPFTNSCLTATKKVLEILCPDEDREAINQSKAILPHQFFHEMYHYVQEKDPEHLNPQLVLPKNGMFPVGQEPDTSRQYRWKLAQFIHNDRASCQANLIEFLAISLLVTTGIPIAIAINNALGEQSNLSDLGAFAIACVAVLFLCACAEAYKAYTRCNNPYNNENEIPYSEVHYYQQEQSYGSMDWRELERSGDAMTLQPLKS